MRADSTLLTIAFMIIALYYFYIFILAIFVKPIPACSEESRFRFIFLVPCRNEEKVLSATLRHMLEVNCPLKEILVVDDGSGDKTADIARQFDQVQVVSTIEPGKGKGEALNYGFRHVIRDLKKKEVSNYENIIICVVDGDGQVAPDILKSVQPYFDDPEVGAVQTSVRISNADSNIVAKCQDIEFIGFSSLVQKGRDCLGSVGLGGNGQFVRLSALCSLSMESPWNRSLTEDFDIGLRLIMAGWKVRFCSNTYVAQQGLGKFRPLITQRARWMQGHYSCWKYVPRLLSNRNLRLRTRLDNTAYLILGSTPLLVLACIVLSLFAAVKVLTISNAFSDFLLDTNFLLYLAATYLLSFIISMGMVSSYLREKKASLFHFLYLYHVFAFYTLLWIPSSMAGLFNLARGKKAWAKTGRAAVDEFSERRAYPRVEFGCPVRIMEGEEVELNVRDISAGGLGVRMKRLEFQGRTKEIVSTGNHVIVMAPVSGRLVHSVVVWVAKLGRGEICAGIQFRNPPTVQLQSDFGYADPYPEVRDES
ncbi:MAG: glycosyltransferase [Actinomycetota bacterium]|nr:glycosyltransferase [Actinomycetota bacterium]